MSISKMYFPPCYPSYQNYSTYKNNSRYSFCGKNIDGENKDIYESEENKCDKDSKMQLKDKLAKTFRSKHYGFMDDTRILEDIQSDAEIDFLSNYLDKNSCMMTRNTLVYIAKEFSEFRKTNGRSMNNTEMELFSNLLPGLESRSMWDSKYKGDIVSTLIPMARTEKDTDDILSVLKSDFPLKGCHFRQHATKNEKAGGAVKKLIDYKKENSEIGDLIIDFAKGSRREKERDFEAVKGFFDFFKAENNPQLLKNLMSNKDMSISQIKGIYSEIKDDKELETLLEPVIKKEPPEYVVWLIAEAKGKPEMTAVIKKNLRMNSSIKPATKSPITKLVETAIESDLKTFTGDSKKIDKIKNSVGKDNYLAWEVLVPKNSTKEEADEILQDFCDAINIRQRLASRKNGDDLKWTLHNKVVVDSACIDIKEGKDFATVLDNIAKGYASIFGTNPQGRGTYRQEPSSHTVYSDDVYSEYKDRFNALLGKPRKAPYDDIELTRLLVGYTEHKPESVMLHPSSYYVKSAINHAKNNYDKFQQYVKSVNEGKALSSEEMEDAKNQIAEIHFLMSNSMPFKRGTAGIANIMTRSLYKSIGVSLPATKVNTALDLEAFCNSPDDYKKNWNSFLEDN